MHDILSSVESFAAKCRTFGFDLVRAFSVGWFNATVEEGLRLHDFGRPGALGLIVGNSKALWPTFLGAVADEPALLEAAHPLDEYVVRSVAEAAKHVEAEHVVLFAHETTPRAIPIQRIAEAAGLARLSPSLLSVHPRFGPWIAFRAVLVVNAEGPRERSSPPYDPCTSCEQPCVEALQRAVEHTRSLEGRVVERHWALWARVREVCPQGSDQRYEPAQILYHYAKDRRALVRPHGARRP